MNQLQLPGIRRYRKRPSNRPPRYNEHDAAKIRHISNEVERCRTNLSERVFAEEWIRECRWASSGGGILDLLLPYPITQREAEVAATVVQWLGTNVGTGFLSRCLRRFGETITQVKDHEFGQNAYYYDSTFPTPEHRIPEAWQTFCDDKVYTGHLRERAAQIRAHLLHRQKPTRLVKHDKLHHEISTRQPGEMKRREVTKRLEAVRSRLNIKEPNLKVLL